MQVTKSSIFENHLALELVVLEFDAESFVPQSFEQFKQPLPERIKKAVHKRQAEYLAGRICATQALTALNFDNPIIHTADDRVPIWPAGTFGSITHTKGIAAAIAGIKHGSTGVGIDVEKLMKDSQETKLQTHILRDDENMQFHEFGKQVTHPLSVIFSAKESIYKALYPFVKKYFGFDKARLVAFNETVLTFKIMHDLSKQVQTGLEVNVHYQLIHDLIFTQCLLEKK